MKMDFFDIDRTGDMMITFHDGLLIFMIKMLLERVSDNPDSIDSCLK